MRIGIIGGTGKEGRGMALRWVRAGHQVFIGSRDEARARASVQELGSPGPGALAGEQKEKEHRTRRHSANGYCLSSRASGPPTRSPEPLARIATWTGWLTAWLTGSRPYQSRDLTSF